MVTLYTFRFILVKITKEIWLQLIKNLVTLINCVIDCIYNPSYLRDIQYIQGIYNPWNRRDCIYKPARCANRIVKQLISHQLLFPPGRFKSRRQLERFLHRIKPSKEQRKLTQSCCKYIYIQYIYRTRTQAYGNDFWSSVGRAWSKDPIKVTPDI